MTTIRVLPIDDNPAILRRISEALSAHSDIEIVATAQDGAQALQLIDEHEIDVILLDIVMPKLDGFAVLDALARRDRCPRIIMITSLAGDDFIDRCMRAGASYYMIKPLDGEILYRRIIETMQMSDPLPQQPTAAPKNPSASTDEQITNLFLTIGIPAHIKGYQYLREAVSLVLRDPSIIGRITKELYPLVARRFDTSASKVERAMRHAIEVAWHRGRLDSVNKMYGYTVFLADDKPTNGEFVALVADKIGLAKSA